MVRGALLNGLPGAAVLVTVESAANLEATV